MRCRASQKLWWLWEGLIPDSECGKSGRPNQPVTVYKSATWLAPALRLFRVGGDIRKICRSDCDSLFEEHEGVGPTEY
jgi:hypothetical protein